ISSFPSSSVAVQLFLDASKASTYSCITFSVSVVSNSEAWNIAAVERYIGTGSSSPFGQNSLTIPSQTSLPIHSSSQSASKSLLSLYSISFHHAYSSVQTLSNLFAKAIH
ncbi:hypothetical protein M747DRAFT_374393, partial [Aspergillus niger ATCC 13496]